VPLIADHVADGIAFLDEFRSFAKDRLQLEKEYAQKLEGLCRKYNSKRQKVTTKSSSAQPARPDDEWDWTDKSRYVTHTREHMDRLIAYGCIHLAQQLMPGLRYYNKRKWLQERVSSFRKTFPQVLPMFSKLWQRRRKKLGKR